MNWLKKKSKQSNLFISIGGGINQIPLIEEAKKLKMQVIGVDKDICAAGMFKCDIRIQESIDNYHEIYLKLKELLADGDITGVLTKSFGPAIKTASYISDKLNIPMLPYSRVDDFISKEKMKRIFKDNKINSPGFISFSGNSAHINKKASYPFVIKPVVGHAKSDVELIKNEKELERYLKSSSSKKDGYLLENFIKGDEIIAIGIVHQKKFYLAEITDKVKSDPPYFVDIMHISPSKYINLRDTIQEIGQSVADSFEIVTSPLLMELIVSEDGEIFLIEAAPEFGGEFLSDVLIPRSTGYNIIREAIKAVTNKNFSPPGNKRKSRNAVIVKYITGTKGTLLSFNPVNSKPGILLSRIFKDIGSSIRKPETNHDRIGVIIATGDTIEEAKDRAENAQMELNIRIGKKETGKESAAGQS